MKENEVWFHFGAQPMRFSIIEFHMLRGLKCSGEAEEAEEDKENQEYEWKLLEGSHTLQDVEKQLKETKTLPDREHSAAEGQTTSLSLDYVKKARNMDVLMKYPWGKEAYMLLLKSVRNDVANHLEKTTKFELQGIPLVFHLWILESIPLLQSRFNMVIRTPQVQQSGPTYLCEKYIR